MEADLKAGFILFCEVILILIIYNYVKSLAPTPLRNAVGLG